MAELSQAHLAAVVDTIPYEIRKAMKVIPSSFIGGEYVLQALSGQPVKEFRITLVNDDWPLLIKTIRDSSRGLGPEWIADPVYRVARSGDRVLRVDNIAMLANGPNDDKYRKSCVSVDAACIWYSDHWESVCHPMFYEDLAGKNIRVIGEGFSAVEVWKRVVDLLRKGFSIDSDSLSIACGIACQGTYDAAVNFGDQPRPEGFPEKVAVMCVKADLSRGAKSNLGGFDVDHEDILSYDDEAPKKPKKKGLWNVDGVVWNRPVFQRAVAEVANIWPVQDAEAQAPAPLYIPGEAAAGIWDVIDEQAEEAVAHNGLLDLIDNQENPGN